MSELIAKVKGYWEAGPCGTEDIRLAGKEKNSFEYFESLEEIRYTQEPMIFSCAQFPRHHGKKVLEIGVGAGTDHLQWARAGVKLFGVDLTDAAIATTREHLKVYGFSSELQRVNAEKLPFADHSFDVVYSWGVIHHSENPAAIVKEAHRVLKPGGQMITMFYSKYSLRTWKYWVRYAVLKGKLHWGINEVMWNHMESVGTKCYTPSELKEDIFTPFKQVSVQKFITPYDLTWIPKFLHKFLPDYWGFFSFVRGVK